MFLTCFGLSALSPLNSDLVIVSPLELAGGVARLPGVLEILGRVAIARTYQLLAEEGESRELSESAVGHLLLAEGHKSLPPQLLGFLFQVNLDYLTVRRK